MHCFQLWNFSQLFSDNILETFVVLQAVCQMSLTGETAIYESLIQVCASPGVEAATGLWLIPSFPLFPVTFARRAQDRAWESGKEGKSSASSFPHSDSACACSLGVHSGSIASQEKWRYLSKPWWNSARTKGCALSPKTHFFVCVSNLDFFFSLGKKKPSQETKKRCRVLTAAC